MSAIELESYAFALLRRPTGAPVYPEEELERIQEEHLAHLAGLARAGTLLAAGPFSDQADEALRGLCVFATSVGEARELLARDPAVLAGRLEADVMTWSTEKGSVSFQRS
jgi:uncharacterized protein YciI